MKSKAAFWLILLVGVLLRIIYLMQHRASPFFEPAILDGAYYHAWATKWAAGKWLQSQAFFGLPLYPFMLSLIYHVGEHAVLLTKCIQAVLGILNAVLVYAITQRLFQQRPVALIAMALCLIYKPFIFHETMLIPAALAIVLYSLALLLSLGWLKSQSPRHAFALGLVLGLAGLAKAGIYLYAVFFVALMLMRPIRVKLLQVSLLVGALVLTLVPSTVHNRLASDDFVPVSWHGGINFYIGNNTHANGLYQTPPGIRSSVEGQIADSKMIAERAHQRQLKPSEISNFWYAKGWEFIRQEPRQFLRLIIRKSGLAINRAEISDVENIRFAERYAPLLRFLLFDFTALFVLSVIGVTLAWKSILRVDRAALLGWIACYLAGILFFFINSRYRLPILSSCMPFAAFAVFQIFIWLRARRFKPLAFTLASTVVLTTLTFLPLAEISAAIPIANAGNIHMKQGNYEAAIGYYKEAIATDPAYAKAYNDLGVAYRNTGRTALAKENFRMSIAKDPHNPYAHNNLGLILDAEGSHNQALYHFKRTVEIQPNMGEAYNNLGMMYAKRSQFQLAEQYFQKSLHFKPDSPRALTNLGLIVYQRGDFKMAKFCFARALQIDPSFQEARNALKGMKGK